ncbi:DUF3793 family protein [Paraclostridium bifermentans]|jgi:hypothetical protein|uniref:DUF3793 family protein n=1 Tax=Paraclostridium bifermentans TaxID=1490 RepID=UPI0006B323F3|nr:DUF3793 family protein [Paraclostridium bifermentans]MBU5286831.1 DUF3793 family protein [Paraclostridium bifermentans]MDU3336529.1 DUF3793 family protein [Paraclostridium bifermentans]OSB12244.1 hypothetical protein B2H97_03855 [Paraclostridium bifermentans]
MNIKCDYSCKNRIDSSYIKWILELLGPVILGSKPSEILNISLNDNNKEYKIKEIESFFKNCSRLKYEIVYKDNGEIKILFINKDALSETLKNKKCVNFLKFIGYPNYYTLDNYINCLLDKLKENEFPHEIGIFLGYPLKDVVGFMGYGNYELQKTKYWRVYGNTEISDEIYNKFLEDRKKMRNMLEKKSLDRIKKVV